jgi:hypothetical protein
MHKPSIVPDEKETELIIDELASHQFDKVFLNAVSRWLHSTWSNPTGRAQARLTSSLLLTLSCLMPLTQKPARLSNLFSSSLQP